MKSPALGLLVAFVASTAGAAVPSTSNESVSEVVVTGSRLTEYDANRTPQVTLLRRADNIITEVRVVCDTRDEKQRREELRATLRNMIKGSGGASNIELGVGEEVVGTFDETMLDSVTRPDSKADTTFAMVLVKTHVAASDSFDSATGRIKAFIDRTTKVGRTEILREGDWELTLVAPQQYRPAVVALVAEDSKKVAAAFGAGYGVSVSNLQLPVSWYQAGPLDLALYIPYRLDVVPLQAEHR
jgi:hypothetical protein